MGIITEQEPVFPLSKTKKVKGHRRRAREKVMQILSAHEVSGTPWGKIFSHVFFREFNTGESEDGVEQADVSGKLLTQNEIAEIESDIPIEWEEIEIKFAAELIENVLKMSDYLDDVIKQTAQNWELSRIAKIDRLLMHMAIVELLKCPEIPPKVSINEAIDIAKKYSTDKSGLFINGLLDSIYDKLRDDGLITKTGRGLKED